MNAASETAGTGKPSVEGREGKMDAGGKVVANAHVFLRETARLHIAAACTAARGRRRSLPQTRRVVGSRNGLGGG